MELRHKIISRVTASLFGICLLAASGMFIAIGALEEKVREPLPDIHNDYCATYDQFGPEISLVGDAEITIVQGAEYKELGVEVEDFCGVKTNEVLGVVDTNTPGDYELKYVASDEYGNSSEAVRKITVRPPSRGVVYLTFDDGPGAYTAHLLDVLAKYNVKATFFVTGSGSDDMILREYNEGHTVALHTFSHNYAAIYQNMDTYFADLYAIQDRVKRITGETSMLIRFPGGSSNTVSTKYDGGARLMSALTREVEARGFVYFDWNLSSGDAGGTTTANGVYNNVVRGLVDGGSTVILQHDIKGYSVDAVERIIQYGLANGWSFDKLTASSFTAHHGVNN